MQLEKLGDGELLVNPTDGSLVQSAPGMPPFSPGREFTGSRMSGADFRRCLDVNQLYNV